MKSIVYVTAIALALSCAIPQSAQAGYVKGYYKKDGTYVSPHWSNRGGHTGKVKTKVTHKRTR